MAGTGDAARVHGGESLRDAEERVTTTAPGPASAASPAHVARMLSLQQAAGNAAVARLMRTDDDPAARATQLWDAAPDPAARALRRVARRADRAAELAAAGADDPRAAAYRAGFEHAGTRIAIFRQAENEGGAPAPVPIGKARAPSVADALSAITMALAMPNPVAHREEIFRAILDVGDKRNELAAAYEQQEKRSLEGALQAALPAQDMLRARSYLRHGKLRTAEKIIFASEGAGTDEDTLYRVMREAHGTFAATEADLKADYGDKYGDDRKLFHLSDSSRIAGILESELSGADLEKARATLAFGKVRPVDEVAIAMRGAGTDEDMLFRALRTGGLTLREEWRQYYGGQEGWEAALDDALDDDLDGDDFKKAIAILDGQWDARAEIKHACSGLGTDEEAIWKALGTLTPAERAVFRQEWDAKGEIWRVLDDDLSSGDMDRARALIYGSSGAQARLEQAGAFDGSDIVDAIKLAKPDAFAEYKREFQDTSSSFRKHVSARCTAIQEGHLHTILFGTVEERIRFAIAGIDTDEDYVFHLLGGLDDAGKRAVSGNTALMDAMRSALSTSEYNRALDTLRPGDLSIEQQVAATGDQAKREQSLLTDLFSNSSDALADEQRELESGLLKARVDGELSPEEQAQLTSQHAATQEALAAYISARDAIEDMAANILTTAAAIVVSICTAGAGSGIGAAMIASQLAAQAARAALVSAVVRVLATKVARGDRFDVMGADGAIAFGAGAIDGVLNVFGGKIAQTMINPAFRSAASVEAKVVAVQAWEQTLGRRMVQTAVEGGVGGGFGSAFETSVNEQTWKGGFEAGFTNVVSATGMGVLQGGAMSVGMGGIGEVAGAGGKGGPSGTHLPPGHVAPDGTGAHPHGDGTPVVHGDGTVATPGSVKGAPAAALASAPPALVAALPSHLQGSVPIIVDPSMSSPTGVRVHYDVDPDGIVTGIHMRVGPEAGAAEIGVHVRTVETMQKYSGLAGRLRSLLRRFQDIVGVEGEPRPGTRAFEAKLEVDKLPKAIQQKLDTLQRGGLDPAAAERLKAEIADLERQLVDFQKVLEEMDLSGGRGFVAADARDPGLQAEADALTNCGPAMKDALARNVNVDLANRLRTELADMFAAVKSNELDAASAQRIVNRLGDAARQTAIAHAEAQMRNALAELRRARRVVGDVPAGQPVRVGLKPPEATALGFDIAPMTEADALYRTTDGKLHLDEVKGSANALVEKLRGQSDQLDRLRKWRDGGPDRVAEIVVDSDDGWTKIFGMAEMVPNPKKPGEFMPNPSGKHGLERVIDSGLPLRIGDRLFTPAQIVALNAAIRDDMIAANVGSARAVMDGKASMTYGDYLTNCIPTLAATAARLGSKMP